MSINSEFNNQLIQIVNLVLPKKADRVQILSDIISVGKEAVYRRLRGEVLFSFEEACKIAGNLGFSLDNIAKTIAKNEKVTFELQKIPQEQVTDYCTYYYNLILTEYENFEVPPDDPSFLTMTACNTIPLSMLMQFPELFRFKAFQWTYLMRKETSPLKFSDIAPTEDMVMRQRLIARNLTSQHEQIFIFDHRIFASLVDQIKYFFNQNLISEDEMALLKKELIAMITHLETIASEGRTKFEKYLWIFMSNVDLDANCTYVRKAGFECTYFDVYQTFTVQSSDARVCKIQREWIESLRKHSTLISVSGERERSKFFDKQREYANKTI